MRLAIKRSSWKGFRLPEELKEYACRMNLWDSIDMEPPCQVNQYPHSGRFLPVQRFDESKRDVQTVAADLIKIINKTLLDEYGSSLSICLKELVNNFFDHANSKRDLPCLIAAQSWPKGELVQVAIADAGIGIRVSLDSNLGLENELAMGNACQLASTYGITSKPSDDHSGYGLTLAKDLMKQANGSYVLISGNEIFLSKQKDENKQNLSSSWSGTVLVLEWSLNSELNSKLVYDSWPISEGFNEDDFL